MPKQRLEFVAGYRAALPLLMGVLPFGVVTGVAMVSYGMGAFAALAMSVLVFAGASMLAAGQLLAAGTPAALVLLAVFFINLRHVMYSASLRTHFARLPLRLRALVGYLLADNVYALAVTRAAEPRTDSALLAYYLGAGATIWIAWQVSVIAGIVVGAGLPAAWKLEFAAPLAFVAMSIPLLRDRAMVAAALAAGITVIAAHGLPFRLGLPLAGVVGIVAGMLVEGRRT